jgi:hypothetical protein
MASRNAHSRPVRCIHTGARGSAPAANGIAAPQPMNQVAGKDGPMRAMRRSCFGNPRPT